MKKLLLVFLWVFILFSSSISLGYNIGFKKITYSQDNLTIVLLYPSETENAAEEHGVFSKGIFPLLIFSHGMEGSADNQYYLASYMAQNGYIVAAIEHDDNPYTFQTLVDRPILIKKAIDLILSDSKINTHIDPNKIGMLGHSLGGYTSFVIAGGEPDFSNHPNLNWLPNFFKKFYIKFRNFDNNFYDSRVKAIAALAPGLGTLFNKKSLSKVNIPVLIIEAEKDEVVLDGSASLYKNNLLKKPDYMILKGAGHYSFLGLCDEYLQKNFAEICYDPGASREELHKIIQQQVLSFFNKTFNLVDIPKIKKNIDGISYYEEAKFKKNEISKSFYYVRHGQTDINKYGIIPENSDVPLNEEGLLQAKEAAIALRDKNIKIIVASPLLRTKQTAEIINKELNVPIIYYDGFKEGGWGALKGENIKQPSKNKSIWFKGGEIAGVESLYSFQTRIHNTIKEVVNKYDDVLIVAHGRYFRYLTILLNEEPINGKNAVPYYFTPILEDRKLYKITPLK